MTVHLYLVRHGQTELNRQHKFQGRTNSALTLKGVAAAKKLATLLEPIHFDKAYSSFSGRASQTAQLIADRHHELSEITAVDGLSEYDFGGLEEKPVLAFWPLVLKNLKWRGPFQILWGGRRVARIVHLFHELDDTGAAETMVQVSSRARQTIQKIASDLDDGNEKNVLIVSHGLVLSAFLYALNARAVPRLLLKNASVTRVDFEHGRFHIVKVNETAK